MYVAGSEIEKMQFMPHLFVNMANEWLVAPLEQAVYAVGAGTIPLRAADLAAPPADARAVLCRLSDASRWALLATQAGAVRVNGCRLAAGLRLLRDRDEIRVQDAQLFYSTERLARVEPFPDPGRPVVCARCRGALEPSSPAVCCPKCNSWCHSSAQMGLPCWQYAPSCPMCDQRTDAETYTWTPSQL